MSALRRFGDLPAAEAELNRLEVLRGEEQPSRHELLIEGQLRLAQGQVLTAEHLLQRLRERMAAEGRKAKEVEALIHLVEVANAEGAWAQARLLAAEARTEPLAPEDVHELAYREGIAAREAGQLDESLALLHQAQTGFPDPAQNWRVENELGKTLERLGRIEEALAAYLRSIADIEALRSSLGSTGLQAWLTESRREPYLAVFELRAPARSPSRAHATRWPRPSSGRGALRSSPPFARWRTRSPPGWSNASTRAAVWPIPPARSPGSSVRWPPASRPRTGPSSSSPERWSHLRLALRARSSGARGQR